MLYWKLTGIIATLVIILSIPLYLIKAKSIQSKGMGLQAEIHPTFVGSLKGKRKENGDAYKFKS